MRIIFFSNSSWSIFNFRRNLIKNLINQNHEIFILSSKDSYTRLLKKMGCKFLKVKIQNNKINLLNDLLLLIKIKKIFSSIKPDYIFNFTIKPLIYGSFVAGLLNIKSVCMMTGLGTMFINKNWLTFIIIILYKISFRKVNKVIFQNKDDRNKFLNLKIINKKRSILSPGSGIDINFFKFKLNKFSKKTKFLLFGRLLKEKGVIEFIKASKIIHKEKLNCDFKIAGNIDKFNSSSVSKKDLKYFLKNKNNTNEKFQYDVRKILNWSNCVVLPSYREGTPRGLLEALSVGRPIITTNAVGCREVVLNNKNGFTSKVKNVNSLYKVIKKFHLLNSENKKKMSFFARFFVVKKFNDQKVIRIYNSIINEK